jgi:hypothetical protein
VNEDDGPQITFEDYEKLMHALEKDGRIDQLEHNSPRAQYDVQRNKRKDTEAQL